MTAYIKAVSQQKSVLPNLPRLFYLDPNKAQLSRLAVHYDLKYSLRVNLHNVTYRQVAAKTLAMQSLVKQYWKIT